MLRVSVEYQQENHLYNNRRNASSPFQSLKPHSLHHPQHTLTPSQQRQPRSSHRQRRPNNLSPRRLRRRRPRRILRDNTRLHNTHTRQVVLIGRGYSAVPARRSSAGYDGVEVVGWVGFDFLEDGFRDGGFEGVEDGGVFGLGGQGREVGF